MQCRNTTCNIINVSLIFSGYFIKTDYIEDVAYQKRLIVLLMLKKFNNDFFDANVSPVVDKWWTE